MNWISLNSVLATELNLLDLLQQGGWAMWPLGLCSMVTICLAMWGFFSTRKKLFLGTKGVRDLDGAHVLGDILSSLNDADHILSPEAWEERFCEQVAYEEAKYMRWIQYLNVIAAMTPMIGLLGTVSGMIGAFQTIAHGGMGKPELLANDIGEALITTATGLAIGIPAMLAYFILKTRLAQCIDELLLRGRERRSEVGGQMSEVGGRRSVIGE